MEIPDIMIELERIRQICGSDQKELHLKFDGEWNAADLSEAVSEAMDILYDYALMAEKQRKLIELYETPGLPIKKADAIYLCPACQRRVYVHHSHCHHCGKAMEWGDITFKGRRRTKYEGNTRT